MSESKSKRVSDGQEIPDGEVLVIKQLYAWVMVDPEDLIEGVLGEQTPRGWMPLVGADQESLEHLRPLAQRAAQDEGRLVTLLRFGEREVVEVIQPGQEETS